MIQRNQPSPQRQTVLTFVSPNVQDSLFFETIDAQRVGNTPPVYGTAHPDSVQFPDHTLAYVRQADPNGQLYYYYYANTRSSQDEYNFEYSQAGLGGTKFDTVVRTYVSLRADFKEDAAGLSAGSAMPTEPAAANFSGKGYILMTRVQKRLGDRELDGIFVVEQRTYFVRKVIDTLKWDNLSHRNLKVSASYLYTGETPAGQSVTINSLITDTDNAYWAPAVVSDPDNSSLKIAKYREGRRLSADWFEIIRTELVAGGDGGGTTNPVIDVDSYFTTVDHTFPPVLESVDIAAWERHDGQLETMPEYNMNPEGYTGPCKVRVDVKWRKVAHSNVQAYQMLPQSFSFTTPYVRINIPPCLMSGGSFTCSTGTADPIYTYNTYEKQLPVTDPPTWPSTLVIRDKQESARGGYIRTTWTVYKPQMA
jgi:hypothetical protein